MRIDYAEVPVTLGGGEVVSLRRPSYARRRPRLRAAGAGRHALAAGGAADDRARAARGGPGGRHPGARRPRRRRRRRHQRAAEPRLVGGGRPADARPLRLEGRAADDPRAGGRGLLRRHRHLDAARSPQGWGDCTAARGRLPRRAARRRAGGRTTTVLDLVTFYSRNLAVPARRDPGDPQVLRGQAGLLRGRLRRLPPAEVRHRPARATSRSRASS